jgi:hypothetical protein
VKKVEGDASIVFASGKKSCVFDLTMSLDWTASLDETGGLPPLDYMKDSKEGSGEKKPSKYSGTLTYHDINSTMDIKSVDVVNKYKKNPAQVGTVQTVVQYSGTVQWYSTVLCCVVLCCVVLCFCSRMYVHPTQVSATVMILVSHMSVRERKCVRAKSMVLCVFC